jgi:fluoride exporter
MNKILMLGTVGFLGTLARYFFQGWVQALAGSSFPFGTLVVNIVGCFILGLVNGLFTERFIIDPQWRISFTIGFCGAFTTFSTLVFESAQLAGGRQWLLAGANVTLSLVLGFLFLWLGMVAARVL